MDIGKQIKQYRQELGLTQKELAEKTGISGVYLSQIERGLYQPSISMIEKITAGLNISEGQLRPKLSMMREKGMREVLTEEQLMLEYNQYHAILVEILHRKNEISDTAIYPAILDISSLPDHRLVACYGVDKELLFMEDYGKEWVAYHYYEAFIDEERNQIK